MNEYLITGAVALFTASSIWNFIMFLIKRKDEKNASNVAIKEAIEKLSDKVAENQAILARTHILRFSDEIRNQITHSGEYWEQTLQDVDTYERYCQAHPDFRNNYATLAIDHIKKTYQKLLEEHKI